MTKINFSTVENKKDFPKIPEDRYELECVDATLGVSENGNETINAQFKIINNENFENRRVWNKFTLVPQAIFNLKNYFEAAGLNTEVGYDSEEIPAMLLGSKVTAFISYSEFNDKPRYDLKNWAACENSDSLFK